VREARMPAARAKAPHRRPRTSGCETPRARATGFPNETLLALGNDTPWIVNS
jgi:hypothetical protein